MLIRLVTGLSLLLATGVVLPQDNDGDRLYVTDQLRLSLYQQADAQSQILQYLSSGDLLIVEQLQGAYAFVTTPDGSRGWVKRGFLVSKPTATLLLSQEREKTAALEAEIEKLSNSKLVIDQYEKDMNALSEQMQSLQQEHESANETIESLQQEIEARQRELELRDQNRAPVFEVLWQTLQKYWQTIVPIVLGIILISFVISKAIVESRIKKKFHGIKIW